jgi:hypothetical protein
MVLKWLSRKKRVTANAIEFDGEGVYQIALPELGYGLVFEDNGETGYLYITDEVFANVHDAVHIYDRNDAHRLQAGQEVFVVWSSDLQKAGLYYDGDFQAGVDFKNRRAVSRTGFPESSSSQWSRDHTWRDEVVHGLER